jgi:hypothetical protein
MRLFVFAMFTATVLFSEISVAEFDSSACKKALSSKADNMDCQLGFETNDQEKQELMTKTFGIVQHINCTTQLNILKSDIIFHKYEAMRSQSPSKIELSSHKIGCDVETNGDKFQIVLTLASWIELDKKGVSAVNLKVSEVSGVPPFIGKKLIEYGNAPELQAKAKEILNQLLKHLPF